MSNTPVQSSPYSEDWSSYRKLVVDTLKRLDDRTLDTFQRLSDLSSRVHVIEHAGHDKDVARLETRVDAITTRIDGVDDDVTAINKTLAEAAGAQKIFIWLVGAVCACIGFAANLAVDKLLP